MVKIDDQNPDDFKNIDSKYYWSLVEFKMKCLRRLNFHKIIERQSSKTFLTIA